MVKESLLKHGAFDWIQPRMCSSRRGIAMSGLTSLLERKKQESESQKHQVRLDATVGVFWRTGGRLAKVFLGHENSIDSCAVPPADSKDR